MMRVRFRIILKYTEIAGRKPHDVSAAVHILAKWIISIFFFFFFIQTAPVADWLRPLIFSAFKIGSHRKRAYSIPRV